MNTTVLKELCNGTKRNNAIVFFLNSGYRFALAEMLVNLQKTNMGLYDNIIVCHADLTEEDIKGLTSIEPKCIFIEYSYEEWVKQYKEPSTPKAQAFVNQYSYLAYEKYRIFEMLEFYHKVLFLDLDMLVLDDISEVFELKGAAWRDASEDFGTKLKRYVNLDVFQSWSNEFNAEARVPNAGLIYVSDEGIDYRKCVDEGYAFIREFIDYFNHAIDELAISWIVAKQGIELTSFERERYNTLPAWYTYDTKVVHFMNRDKIWNSEFMQTLFPQWMVNYKESKRIASFESDSVVEYTIPCVRKKLNQESWFEFFLKTDFQVPDELWLQYDFSKGGLCMKYKKDIFWEIILDLYTKKFRIGLWVRDNKLVNSTNFIADMKKFSKYDVESSEKGIYVSTAKMELEDVSNAFTKFYSRTYNCVIEYLEMESCDSEVLKKITFFRRNNLSDVGAKEYFDNIRNQKERYTVIISCRDECSRYFNEFIDVFGIKLTVPNKRDSYIAVISDGTKLVEKMSENRLNYSFKLQCSQMLWVSIVSEGYRRKKEKSSIVINNIDYSMNERGLNFVIIDKYYGCVVDYFNIDTYKDNKFVITRNVEKCGKISMLEEAINKLI